VTDAVVVGSGPNGLAAAVTLAGAGWKVLVREGSDRPGGGARTEPLTLPGFAHDVCSAVHPLARASPYLRTLPLERHGVDWIDPPAPLAHPFDDGTAALLLRSPADTAAGLGEDGAAWRRLMEPLLAGWEAILDDVLRPLRLPRHPRATARFGLLAVRSAAGLARASFTGARARALFAGVAAHAVAPLDAPPTAAYGLVLALAAHAVGWPFPRGGAGRITGALAALLRARGGELTTSAPARRLEDLPPARAVLCDVTPRQLLALAGARLPAPYRARLARWRYGPGAYKLDWALSGPIPWRARECALAGTVHLGGTLEEIAAAERAAWQGEPPSRPFVLLAQPSLFDPTRAPPGRHVAWGYCHVPHGWGGDATALVEAQVERFAPGFRELVLARSVLGPRALEAHDPNLVGGDVGGGAATLLQTLLRPAPRLDPYATPVPGLFLCSASTPPGGGVHGMCGHLAARSALRRAGRRAHAATP
jgi:phytoene dehydrogenase-like protein